ncbi:MAG TPA: YbaL family putative K(+) efflux transporter [Gemmatimonadales bacterium]|nr:YbaL family putative K(+) efflux transporter [Gemmatimonadales bacterium]
MLHDTALIVTIAGGIGLAFVLGMLAQRLRLPPLVGYLVAGILAGPYTPGFVADVALAQQLAEIGVILLMFGVGVHFSLDDLLAVRRIAVPGAVVQIVVATVLGGAVAHLWGWSWTTGIVFGLCLSVASTVVLLRALEDRGVLDSVDGRIAIGWLIVEDLATVLVLVLLPAFAVSLGGHTNVPVSGGVLTTLALTLAKVVAFVALMIIVGRRVVPWLLERVARTGSRELFTLAVLAVAIGIAVGAAELFGVSFALGAFVAGMVVNGTDLSHEAAADSLPLQDAFAVLFFVAVGMLFDPGILVRHPLQVLAVVAIVMIGKSLAAFFIVLAFRRPLHTALTISASLAQIGEFSFILASLALALGLMPAEAQNLIVAGALLSIGLNAAAFAAVEPLRRWITARPRLLGMLERPGGMRTESPAHVHAARLHNHAVIVGYGRVGSAIGTALAGAGVPYLVLEQDRQTVTSLRERGIPAFFGDASRPGMLAQVNMAEARLLVVTAPEPFTARAIIMEARKANPAVDIVVRTHTDEERQYLEGMQVGQAVMGERELARAMADYALESCGAPR